MQKSFLISIGFFFSIFLLMGCSREVKEDRTALQEEYDAVLETQATFNLPSIDLSGMKGNEVREGEIPDIDLSFDESKAQIPQSEFPELDLSFEKSQAQAPNQTYDNLSTLTPEQVLLLEDIRIPMLELNGMLFPFPEQQFGTNWSPPDKCDHPHLHAAEGVNLEGEKVKEPKDPCGFGWMIKTHEIGAELFNEWFDIWFK